MEKACSFFKRFRILLDNARFFRYDKNGGTIMNMKKWIAAALAILVTLGALAGCAQKSTPETARYEAAQDVDFYGAAGEVPYAANLTAAPKSAATTLTAAANND